MTAAVTLSSTKAAIVAGVQAALGPFGVAANDVQTHHGRFTLESVKQFAAKTPAARVVSTGFRRVPGTEGNSPISVQVGYIVYLVTSDIAKPNVAKVSRDAVMEVLSGALLAALDANDFGTDPALGLDQPVDIDGENLYSNDAAGLAVLIWGVSWTQGVELDVLTPDEYAALQPFVIFTQTIEDPDDADAVVITGDGPVNN